MKRKKMYQSRRNWPDGFTLIEILITMVIIAIVAGISAPAILSMVPNMRLKAAGRDAYSALQNARMLAIKESRDVTVRFSTPGFIDDNNNGAYDTGEILLGEDPNNNGIFDAGEDINGNGTFEKNSGVKYGNGTAANNWDAAAITQATDISFDSRGIPTVTPAGAAVYLSNENNTDCYAVEVNPAGSIQLHRWNGAAWD
jgi:prepilin-type N-terminal cleavage/methylation domain-containing protein